MIHILQIALAITAQSGAPTIPGVDLRSPIRDVPISTIAQVAQEGRLSPSLLESQFVISDDGKFAAIDREGLEIIDLVAGKKQQFEITAESSGTHPVPVVRRVAPENAGYFSSPVRIHSLLRLQTHRIAVLFTSDARAEKEEHWAGVGEIGLSLDAASKSIGWAMAKFPNATFAAAMDAKGELALVQGKLRRDGTAADLELIVGQGKKAGKLPKGSYGSRLLVYDRQSAMAGTPVDDDRIAIIDSRRGTSKVIDVPGIDRAEFTIGNMASLGKGLALVGLLKAYYPRPGGTNIWIPQLFVLDMLNRKWTYIGSYALIGTSPNGYLLVVKRENVEKSWLLKTNLSR